MTKLELPEEVRAFFRECATRRQRVDAMCAQCGAPLENVTTRRRYCSNTCVQRAKRQRAQAAAAPQGWPLTLPPRDYPPSRRIGTVAGGWPPSPGFQTEIRATPSAGETSAC